MPEPLGSGFTYKRLSGKIDGAAVLRMARADMPESYHNHMIASANQVIEDLYGDGWRLVRLREWLGAYLVNDEVRRKVQP